MQIQRKGLFGTLKDMITKGPIAMANERMQEGFANIDEWNKIDRSDPEAMKAYVAKQNAAVHGELNRHFLTRNVISAENQAHMEHLQNKAMEDQAEFYQMLKEHRAKKAAENGTTPPPPTDETP